MVGGFIQTQDDGSVHYFGPDASILLSNVFLNGHCFRLAEEEGRPGAIGLAFGSGGNFSISATARCEREP